MRALYNAGITLLTIATAAAELPAPEPGAATGELPGCPGAPAVLPGITGGGVGEPEGGMGKGMWGNLLPRPPKVNHEKTRLQNCGAGFSIKRKQLITGSQLKARLTALVRTFRFTTTLHNVLLSSLEESFVVFPKLIRAGRRYYSTPLSPSRPTTFSTPWAGDAQRLFARLPAVSPRPQPFGVSAKSGESPTSAAGAACG